MLTTSLTLAAPVRAGSRAGALPVPPVSAGPEISRDAMLAGATGAWWLEVRKGILRPDSPGTLSDTAPHLSATSVLPAASSWSAEGDQDYGAFGYSVGTAGDVNGDGFSDVIVGAYAFDNGETNEGRAMLFLGSASGLALTPAWSAESNQTEAYFGWSVGTAGDVNGDGYFDVIIGAPRYANGTSQGRAYVYLGSASGLGNSAAWIADSDSLGGEFGQSVATAGDVNGDGYADVIVGAPLRNNSQGRASVYLGSASGLAATAAWVKDGGSAGNSFGSSVASAGDVNGDSYADVIIGANNYSNGQFVEGGAFCYLGSSSGLSNTPVWSAEGDQSFAHFGVAVAAAGDVNGDGFADVIVGASEYDNGQSDEGRAYVYLGSASGPALAAAWTTENNQPASKLGTSVGTAGDVNGDGFADVIVGAPGFSNGQSAEGAAYVYLGSASGLAVAATWSTEANQTSASFGNSVATAGDVNGDGFSDVIVGAHNLSNGQPAEGRAIAFNGSASAIGGDPVWASLSNQPGSRTGECVATAGDVNGDGYADVIVGAYDFTNSASAEGRAQVYMGSAAGLTTTAAWTMDGGQAGAQFGLSVASAGDVNGDGYSDVIVGAFAYDNGQTDEGRAYVYLGSASGLSNSPVWSAEGDQTGGGFGVCVATAGDVNADGYSDILVGAHLFATGGVAGGRAFLFMGSASGPGATPAWTADGNQADAWFGYSVATAGDVNRDGYSDVIVGARGYTNGQTEEGRAYAYLGSASGLAATPSWSAESDNANASFGKSVATAGDVNGDGFSDVIVGALGYNSGRGRAYAYYGSAAGIATTAAWIVDGDPLPATFGWFVASAGDVNGDGFSDVVVSAPQPQSAGQPYLFLYLGSPAGLATVADWIPVAGPTVQEGGFASTAGDVNGDGFSDLLVGQPNWGPGYNGEGVARLYLGNSADGVDRRLRQLQPNSGAPIHLLGKSASNSFRLQAIGRSPAGRGRVRMEWEARPLGTPFGASGHTTTSALNTGFPSAGTGSAVQLSSLPSGLLFNTAYHWRLRVLTDSPFFPRTSWFSLAYNGPAESDVRTAPAALDVANAGVGSDELSVKMIRPNPSGLTTAIVYTLPRGGSVALWVHDLQGRRIATLVDGDQAAGQHTATWDGRDLQGKQVMAGVYWLRLRSGGELVSGKVVRE